MSAVDVVLPAFRSVEERNPQLAAEVYHDDQEFHWLTQADTCGRQGAPEGADASSAIHRLPATSSIDGYSPSTTSGPVTPHRLRQEGAE
jgi:hypothetical protein